MIYVQKMGGKPVPPVERQKLYAPIILGQSNIDGRVSISELPSDVANPSSKVKIYSSGIWNNWDSTSPPEMYSHVQAYATDTLVLNRLSDILGETVYAIKKSRGGSTVTLPAVGKGSFNINATGVDDHYGELVNRIINTRNYVENVLGMEFIVPYIWFDIGETDSSASNRADCEVAYKEIFNSLRTLIGDMNVPIVHRQLGLYQAGVYQWFLDMQESFAAGEVNNYILVSGDGLTLQDQYHFDANGTNILAGRIIDVVKHFYPSYTE